MFSSIEVLEITICDVTATSPFYSHGLTLISARISNHIPSKLYDEINYLLPNSQKTKVWHRSDFEVAKGNPYFTIMGSIAIYSYHTIMLKLFPVFQYIYICTWAITDNNFEVMQDFFSICDIHAETTRNGFILIFFSVSNLTWHTEDMPSSSNPRLSRIS